eukprot:4690565-Lingulodinium_polyedra.AAC.1
MGCASTILFTKNRTAYAKPRARCLSSHEHDYVNARARLPSPQQCDNPRGRRRQLSKTLNTVRAAQRSQTLRGRTW